MDEIGRGTATSEGTAIAYACIAHLYNINQCRVLFATHFHELAGMIGNFENATCYCTDSTSEVSCLDWIIAALIL